MRVANPLPVMLGHYQEALLSVLAAAEIPASPLLMPSAESIGSAGRVARGVRILSWSAQLRADPEDVVILWPPFGLLQPLLTLRSGGSRWIVVHDPLPLRPQVGMGSLARRLGRVGQRSGCNVVVHSDAARSVLQGYGWHVVYLPAPALPPRHDRPNNKRECLRVIGQWKQARTLRPLEGIAMDAGWDGRREIIGRGWPAVDGWVVEDRFLAEDDFDAVVQTSAAVLLPYDRYFQSDVAIRCLERGVPVVGAPTDFLIDLYGADWPGLVVDGDWSAAARRAAAVPGTAITELHERYWQRCIGRWSEVFAAVNR